MALIGSRGRFTEKVYSREEYCSECACRFPKGHTWLVDIRGGAVKKRICSEECRETFDTRVWEEIAEINEKRRGRR